VKEFSDEYISYVSRSVRFLPGPRELEGLKPPKWQGWNFGPIRSCQN
jgi:hypothetical protein